MENIKNEYKSTLVDSPVTKDENDLLNLSDYKSALVEYLKHARAPLTISLQGGWGSGKTSLMNLLKNDLCVKEKSPFLSVWINTWQFSLLSDPSDTVLVVINILQSIVEQIAEKDPEDKFRTHADNTVSLLLKGARFTYDILGTSMLRKMGLEKEDLDNAIKNIKSSDSEKTQSKVKIDSSISLVEQLKKQISSLVDEVLSCAKYKDIKKGFLFFIDDLDRIKPTLAVEILEILKNILDFDYCISIIAIDYSVVVEGLKAKLTDKNDKYYRVYFDKLIQVQIAMPVLNYDIKRFLCKALDEISYFKFDYNNNELEKLAKIIKISVDNNPRNLKRLINNLSLADAFRRSKFGLSDIKNDGKSIIADKEFIAYLEQNDADIKTGIFILACIQIAYPEIYKKLLREPNFTVWGWEEYKNNSSYDDENDILRIKNDLYDLYEDEDCSSIDAWEVYLYNLYKSNKLQFNFFNLLYILNRLDKILSHNKKFISSTIAIMLLWLRTIDFER